MSQTHHSQAIAELVHEKSVEILEKRFSGYGGVIAVTKDGDYGTAYNTPRMARAVFSPEMSEPVAEI